MHQEQEVYHRLYKDKLEKLIKEALAERLPELKDVPNDSDNEVESDEDGNSLSRGKGTEAKSLRQIRVLCMKLRCEVRSEAWENETEEVRREVRKEWRQLYLLVDQIQC